MFSRIRSTRTTARIRRGPSGSERRTAIRERRAATVVSAT
jgi:hypothetical protein